MAIEPLELAPDERGHTQFNGVRMTADEYFDLPDDGFRYELVHGVLVMSPSPMPWHQGVAVEILAQLMFFLRSHPVGKALAETDVHLGVDESGDDLVYRPDVVFFSTQRARGKSQRLVPPDLVVEVISPDSRRRDTLTKRADYERAGVSEYWIIDPPRETMTFLRLQAGKFVEIPPATDSFPRQAVPGFTLDLGPIREAFKPW
jgi:Uma2 family endonuclease